MKHEFEHRKSAVTYFRFCRKTWDNKASYILTLRHYAADPIVRLSAAIALAAYKIPQDGKYEEVRH